MGGARMSNQPSILVVDDEMGILDVLRILLKGEGFDVTTAQGGKAGLEALKGNPPDIVLTDIKMPGVAPKRDPGRQPGGVLLHPEAVLERRPRRHLPARGGAAPAQGREQAAQA